MPTNNPQGELIDLCAPGDLFIEETDTAYVWQLIGFDDENGDAIAKRILVRFNHPPTLGGTYWRVINCEPDLMNQYTRVKLLDI